MAEFCEYTFDCDQDEDGAGFITIEPSNEELSVLKEGLLIFELKAGVKFEDIEQLTEKLNSLVRGLSFSLTPGSFSEENDKETKH